MDEAELTNSPRSLSVLKASFEVMPSSLASSWTRTLATVLLFWPHGPERSRSGCPSQRVLGPLTLLQAVARATRARAPRPA